ncbi:hypothetical protein ACQZ4Y_19880 [Rhizobium sp. L80/93]|uniref:hypothetical protein n=1 Tax=unclassified Rhizobium TaxID=2613769 RepID=UPI001ADBA9D4|nr:MULTISPECIES: hypothetical protein [unclassified Rhizobium]MBO9188046.1 hypothetical protein [Rhizobium sp. E27B/91]QXZ99058.1 hypothetical protein J5289_21405 [Rhizobium sp. B230/85]
MMLRGEQEAADLGQSGLVVLASSYGRPSIQCRLDLNNLMGVRREFTMLAKNNGSFRLPVSSNLTISANSIGGRVMPSVPQAMFERIENEWSQFRQSNENNEAGRRGLDASMQEISVQRVKELALLAVAFRQPL